MASLCLPGLHGMRHTWPARFDKLLETVEMNTNDFVPADQNFGIRQDVHPAGSGWFKANFATSRGAASSRFLRADDFRCGLEFPRRPLFQALGRA
jgi:hypothetical protein